MEGDRGLPDLVFPSDALVAGTRWAVDRTSDSPKPTVLANMLIQDEKVPLTADESGAIHVAGTRVTLDCVAEMFADGASPEEIVEQYDVLQLADIYAVITYMLRHQDEVNTYLARPDQVGEERRTTIDGHFPTALRTKLIKAGRQRNLRED